jgi:hypothetical protein
MGLKTEGKYMAYIEVKASSVKHLNKVRASSAEHLKKVKAPIVRCFTKVKDSSAEHLDKFEATYWSHLRFTWGEMVRCEFMGVMLLIHGLIPCLFHDRFSKYIPKAQKRIDKFQHTSPTCTIPNTHLNVGE